MNCTLRYSLVREVNADRIFAANIIQEVIVEALEGLEDPLLASYRLTRYLLLFLVREALQLDRYGRMFTQNPGNFIAETDGANRIRKCARQVVDDLIVDLNAEVKERNESEDPVDYKRELKSPKAVRSLSKNIISQYQKVVSRGRASSFEQEWLASRGS